MHQTERIKRLFMLTAFHPIADQYCQILILGSMPSVASLEKQQYYAHQQNQFWRIISDLFRISLPEDYTSRKQLLVHHHVALWDVLQNCQRSGSSDSAIRNPAANDFAAFYHKYPKISLVYFNGGKAEELYRKLVLQDPKQALYASRKPAHRLPSTSPANTMPYEEKLARWQIIIENL